MGIISMKKNNIGYLLREGFKGVFLHGFMSFAAICVTVACLIIMGTFSLILYNLHVMILDLEQENEILVYIDENYPRPRQNPSARRSISFQMFMRRSSSPASRRSTSSSPRRMTPSSSRALRPTPCATGSS